MSALSNDALNPVARSGTDVPTLAVVDSRNMVHQAEEVLGYRTRPTVSGVIDALSLYGFEVLDVHVGLALARRRDREALSEAHRDNAAYKREIEDHPRGCVLEGELHVKDGGRAEEKMVDVACAVDITEHAVLIAQGQSPYRAIVVLSQDIDLTPAYKFAASAKRIPLYVASSGVVDKREYPYLLLGEAAFLRACPTGYRPCGASLRDTIARMALEQRHGRWVFERFDRSRGGLVMRDASGVPGLADPKELGRLDPGDERELYAAGVDFGVGARQFPLLTLTREQLCGPRDLRKAVVTRRLAPRELELKMSNGQLVKAYCEIGHCLSGAEVLVQVRETHRLVGALAPTRALILDGQELDPMHPLLVKVLTVRTPSRAIGADEKGRRCTVLANREAGLKAGQTFATVPIDLKPHGRERLVVQAISSALPL
jgi:hypothetical protein